VGTQPHPGDDEGSVALVTPSSTIKCLTGIARRSETVTLNIKSTRDHLQTLDYKTLFIEDLGWSRPLLLKPISAVIHNTTYMLGEIAELAGVAVFEVRAKDDKPFSHRYDKGE
jgi:hypothetical protein